jgi:uncharacterized membrane protein
MDITNETHGFPALAGHLFALYSPLFALLPVFHRPEIPEELIKIVLTIHIFGIIFWIGGLGVRLFLLGSVKSGTDQVVRGHLFETQRRLFRQVEVPAIIVALIAGLFLAYSGANYYQRPWFLVKMLLVLGAIGVDLMASRQFVDVNATGKDGRAAALGAVLVVLAALMVFASN